MKYVVYIMFKEEDIFDAEVMDNSIRIDIAVNYLDKIEDILDISNIRDMCLKRLKLCKQFEEDMGKRFDTRGLEVVLRESNILDNVEEYILMDSEYTRNFILNNIRDKRIYISNRFRATKKDFDLVEKRYGDIDNIRLYIRVGI